MHLVRRRLVRMGGLEGGDGVPDQALLDHQLDLPFLDPLQRAGAADVRVASRQRSELALAEDLPAAAVIVRSEEHTSELQSRENLVCRLLLEKKKKISK